jgi:clan AA aspartic protease (TIGR02281 family)
MYIAARRAFHRYRIVPSLLLALLLTAGAGLPGLVPLSRLHTEPLMLMAMTELKAAGNGHFVTSADINNKSVSVLVDTGASVVALSYEDAEKVGLRPRNLTFDISVSTANGACSRCAGPCHAQRRHAGHAAWHELPLAAAELLR